jgi:predicted O-methyltransferase YrrM
MAAIDWDFWGGEGADGFDYCQSIYELAQHFKPRRGLEIGVRFGKSALATLLGSPNMALVGIDPNPEYPVEEFLVRTVADRFEFVNEASPEALERFEDESFDWVYIDGLHDYRGVLIDFWAAWPLLKKGGVMVFDDYDDTLGYDTGVKQMLEDYAEVITGKPFEYKTMTDFGCHPSPHADAVLIK